MPFPEIQDVIAQRYANRFAEPSSFLTCSAGLFGPSRLSEAGVTIPRPKSLIQSTTFLPTTTQVIYFCFSETRPLLPKATVTGNGSYLDTPHPTRVNVSPATGQSPTDWAAPSSPHLHELGWIEYLLPDASFYYVHPTLRVTTDIDLRNSKKLTAVSSYFERYKDGAPVGLELWLCEKQDKRKKRDTALVEWWVDHGKRSVSSERPGERLNVKGGDDGE